jgi:hypothetical protein
MGTLMQLHHELGMLVSFIVALALSGVAAAAAQRAIPEPTR